MKSSELKTVSLCMIARENLVTSMMMEPSITIMKILIFRNYSVFDEPQFVKKLRRNLRVFLLINGRWVDVYCALTIRLTSTRCIMERQRKMNIQHDDRLSWAFRVFIHVPQYPISLEKPVYNNIWDEKGRFIIQNSSCTLNVPMLFLMFTP